MKPQIGLYVRDTNLNLYRILDERKAGARMGQAVDYQVECIKGPNLGKIRWVGGSTIAAGDYPVSKE
jgi:hypothetical protein